MRIFVYVFSYQNRERADMNLTEQADDAKRCSDNVNLHVAAAIAQGDLMGVVGKWVAIKLEDGSSPDHNSLYDNKQEAVDHQSNPKLCCYIQIPPDGMPANHAAAFLRISRHPYIDTTAPEHILNPAYYPRFSNLSAAQKRALKKELKRNAN